MPPPRPTRTRPYRSPIPPKREQPDIIEARLVSNSPYASLDKVGRYKVRALFEPGLHPRGHDPEPVLSGCAG